MNFGSKKRPTSRKPNIQKPERNLPVTNYYRPAPAQPKLTSTQNQDNSQKRRRLSLTRVVNYLIAIGAVGLVVFATTLSTNPTVELRKDNAKYYEAAVYEAAASDATKASIFNRSKLLFQDTEFIRDLKTKFPEISTVKPIMPLGGRDMTVIITVSEPFAYVTSGNDNGILNSDGVLVVKNGQSVPDNLINLRFTESQSNFAVGSRIMTESELHLLTMLVRETKSLQFSDSKTGIIKQVLFNVADGQMEAQLQDKPFYIKLSTFTTDGDQQVGGAIATLKQLDRENSLPTKYIDVRVPGRAFVL
jgi:hypothetical protein